MDREYGFEGDTVTVTGVADTTAYPYDRLHCTVTKTADGGNVAVAQPELLTETFVMPASAVRVSAEFWMEPYTFDVYSYSAGSGLSKKQQTEVRYTVLTADTAEMTDGWCAVTADTTLTGRLSVKKGDAAYLVVPAGVTLTAPKGIRVPESSELYFFGTGSVKATASGMYVAGIGGNKEEKNGTISFHGVSVEASGGYKGAGIGGGNENIYNAGGEGGNVTIRGNSIVTVYGVDSAEAIGAGYDDSKSGTLRLDDHLCVLVGGEPVPAKNRTKKAHSSTGGKTLVVKPCEHTDVTITIESGTHTITCNSCYAHTVTEEHRYEGATGCASLTRIRIPSGCALSADVFDGCAKVYVFGTAGSAAEAYCRSHSNCVFVPLQ